MEKGGRCAIGRKNFAFRQNKHFKEEWSKKLVDFILPLSKEYIVHFGNVRKDELKDVKPEVKLMLRERGDYLLFQPVFNYNGYDVKSGDREK